MTIRKFVDTNIIIRAVTGQPAEMANRVRAELKEAAEGNVELVVPSLIVAESVYVLQSLKVFSREDIVKVVRGFCTLPGVVLEETSVVLSAFTNYERTNVDFQDAYLAAKSVESGFDIMTFDKDYKKLGGTYHTP